MANTRPWTEAPLWPNTILSRSVTDGSGSPDQTRPQSIFNDRFAFDYDLFDSRLLTPDARDPETETQGPRPRD